MFDEFGTGKQVRAIGKTLETWFFDAAGHRFRAPEFAVEDYSFDLIPRSLLNEILADAAGRRNIRLSKKGVDFEEEADGVTVEFADGTSERADLLIGADGVYWAVRNLLVPGFPAEMHVGHHVWRVMMPSGNEPEESTVLMVGHKRTRGGFTHTYGGQVTWMVNQVCSESRFLAVSGPFTWLLNNPLNTLFDRQVIKLRSLRLKHRCSDWKGISASLSNY